PAYQGQPLLGSPAAIKSCSARQQTHQLAHARFGSGSGSVWFRLRLKLLPVALSGSSNQANFGSDTGSIQANLGSDSRSSCLLLVALYMVFLYIYIYIYIYIYMCVCVCVSGTW